MGICESFVVVKLVVAMRTTLLLQPRCLLRKQKLDENAMHYEHRQQTAPHGGTELYDPDGRVLLLLLLLETTKRGAV